MKQYYSDKENNVCINDENGFVVKLIDCADKEQCDEFCKECNKQVKAEGERNDEQRANSKDIH